jgi:hypothetical protein
MEWLNMFSGGLDIIPVILGIYLIYYIPSVIKVSKDGYKIAYYLSILLAVSMIIAQSGWVYAVTQGVYLLGTAFDNIWLIVNTCAVLIPLIFAHEQMSGSKDE